jgi:hypothetical protein
MDANAAKEVTDPRTWSAGAIVALCALIVFVAYLFWQLGFNYGSRQSNDLLLTSPDANAEVIQLRAQLEEARTFQDTVLNVVLASFAAGFTLLVLVNVGVIVLAQRNYERDERAMRSVLTSETNEKIQAEAMRASDALATAQRDLDRRLDERISTVSDHLASEIKNVDSAVRETNKTTTGLLRLIGALQDTTLRGLSRLDVENQKNAAYRAQQTGRYLEAAMLYSRIVIAEQENAWVGSLSLVHNVPPLLRTLEQATLPGYATRRSLEVIKEALTLASDSEFPILGVEANELANSLARVEAILEELPEDRPGVEPPSLPPDSGT